MTTRRIELLRYLPLALTQFDSTGKVMEQNPEAMQTCTGSNSCGPTFAGRFVDIEHGDRVLNAILGGDENSKSQESKVRDDENNKQSKNDNNQNSDTSHEDESKKEEETK